MAQAQDGWQHEGGPTCRICSLGAERLLTASDGSGFAFPRYNKADTTNANAASAGLNEWLKAFVPNGATLHSFQHSMRDRLRAVECPADIVDQIGGWQTGGLGHGYGTGYPLAVLRKWMQKVSRCSGSLAAERSFSLWRLFSHLDLRPDGYHDVSKRAFWPYEERVVLVRYHRDGIQIRRVRGDEHDVWPLEPPPVFDLRGPLRVRTDFAAPLGKYERNPILNDGERFLSAVGL